MLLIIPYLAGCAPSLRTATAEIAWRCTPPPPTFGTPDLVGEWQVTHEAAVVSDILVLREDGTYRQVYQKSNGYRYEGPWQLWWVERRPSGGLYLHLKGMRYCDALDEVCADPKGGTGDLLLYDWCEDRLLTVHEEVILNIIGATGTRLPHLQTAPRGIALMHLRSSPDSGTRFFVLAGD